MMRVDEIPNICADITEFVDCANMCATLFISFSNVISICEIKLEHKNCQKKIINIYYIDDLILI